MPSHFNPFLALLVSVGLAHLYPHTILPIQSEFPLKFYIQGDASNKKIL